MSKSSVNKIRNNQINSQPEIKDDYIFQLLTYCSRVNLDYATQEKIDILLRQEIDWNKLIGRASRHGVMPLLHKNLKNSDCIPKYILHQLKGDFLDNLRRNLLLTRELNKVLELFEGQQVAAIPFKGPILAISAYGNLSLRQFGDLDILVKQEDCIKAKDILIERGYYSNSNWFLNERQEKAFIQSMGEYSLYSQDNLVNIDLHNRLVAGYLFTISANLDFFWNSLQSISLLDRKVETFKIEDNLLYLCIHGSKSFWEKLIWLCDVSESIDRNPNLNWQYLLEKSQTIGCQRMLLLGCFLANQILDTKLPSEVIERIGKDRQIESLAAIACQKLRGEIQYPRIDEYTFSSFLFYIKLMDKLTDKLRYSVRVLLSTVFYRILNLFRPTAFDRDFIKLPENLYFLYYAIKPIRVIKQYF